MKAITKLFIFLLLVFVTIKGYAQVDYNVKLDSSKVYVIILTDGTQLIGKLIDRKSDYIVFKTASVEKLNIKYNQISKISELNEGNLKRGQYWFDNPKTTGYFFTSSAYSLNKGEIQYKNTYMIINTINIGVTNHFSVLAGTEIYSLIMGSPGLIFSPKLSFDLGRNSSAAVGVFGIMAGGQVGGLLYGVTTFGNRNNNITIGGAWDFLGDQVGKYPAINISGMVRISRRILFVSENWISSTELYPIFSYGVRFVGERISGDLGFFNNSDLAKYLPIGFPVASLSVNFRKR